MIDIFSIMIDVFCNMLRIDLTLLSNLKIPLILNLRFLNLKFIYDIQNIVFLYL